MYEYPHTIENGAGEKLTFVRVVPDPAGDYVEVTNEVQPGAGPPMHAHYLQEEELTVVSGRIGCQTLGGEPKYGDAGSTVHFAAGVPHKFWVEGDEPLVCSGYIKPPDNVEYFLTKMYASTRANGGKQPSAIESAYLMGRYGNEFGMYEIPGFVQRFVFPVLVVFGKLTGRLDKYKDAPPPVHR